MASSRRAQMNFSGLGGLFFFPIFMREVSSIKPNRTSFSVLLLVMLSLWLMGFSLFSPDVAAASAVRALSLCAGSVVPSLAVFVIGAKILIKTGFVRETGELPDKTPLSVSRDVLCRVYRLFHRSCFWLSDGGSDGIRARPAREHDKGRGESSHAVLQQCRPRLYYRNRWRRLFRFGANRRSFVCCADSGIRHGGSSYGKEEKGGRLFSRRCFVCLFAADKRRGRRRVLLPPPWQKGPRRCCPFAALLFSFRCCRTLCFRLFWRVGWEIPSVFSAALRGLLEISGGFAALGAVRELSQPVLFALSGLMLGFGGLPCGWQAAGPRQLCGHFFNGTI